MDEADKASILLEDTVTNNVLKLQLEKAIRESKQSLTHCEDCDAEIPLARQTAVKGCTKCVICQTKHERAYK
jgi:phage/conjugal plasmid C-4 type zinc finger TraR family protein